LSLPPSSFAHRLKRLPRNFPATQFRQRLICAEAIVNRMAHPAAQIELYMLLNGKQILQPVAPAWCSIAQTGRYGGGQF